MPQGISVVISRLDHAEQYLDRLKAEFKATRQPGELFDAVLAVSSAAPVLWDQQPRFGTDAILAAHVVEPPLKWSFYIGDVVHNARSALDNIVFRLVGKYPDRLAEWRTSAKRTTKQAIQIVHFPVYRNATEFEANWKVNALRAVLNSDEFAAIRASQPFEHTKARPESDSLWILNTLNNIDKHRTILVVDKRLVVPTFIGSQRIVTNIGALKTGMQYVKVPVPPNTPNGAVDMNPPSVHILFKNTGVCDGTSIILTLRKLITDCREVVNRFRPFFVS